MSNPIINAENLIQMGGKLWEKDHLCRVYLSADIFNGLYGTNLSDKTNKFYFDCATSQMMRSYKGKQAKAV